MGRKPIEITKNELKELIKRYSTQGEIADVIGCSQATISNKIEEYGLGATALSKTKRDSRIERPKYGYDKTKEKLLKLEEQTAETVGYSEVDIEIETDLPIRLIPLADWHIGARHVAYSRLFEAVDIIESDSQTFTTLNGDLIDNYNTSGYKGGRVEQELGVQEQKYDAENIVKRLTPSALSIINGCHEEWSFLNDGFDFAKYLSKHSKGYYMGHNGKINLTVGDITYGIYVTHNTKYHSSFNMGHGLARSHEKVTEFDIGIGAHYHTSHFEQRVVKDKILTLVFCGAFKGQSRHASKKEFPKPSHLTPGLVLYPNERKVMGSIDYRRVGKYL